jgi:hypothetical protein
MPWVTRIRVFLRRAPLGPITFERKANKSLAPKVQNSQTSKQGCQMVQVASYQKMQISVHFGRPWDGKFVLFFTAWYLHCLFGYILWPFGVKR